MNFSRTNLDLAHNLFVGRGYDPAEAVELLSSNGFVDRLDPAKNEHFTMVKVVGGVMTPPYEVLLSSPLNCNLKQRIRQLNSVHSLLKNRFTTKLLCARMYFGEEWGSDGTMPFST